MLGLRPARMIAKASPAPCTSRTRRVVPSDHASVMYLAGHGKAIGTVLGSAAAVFGPGISRAGAIQKKTGQRERSPVVRGSHGGRLPPAATESGDQLVALRKGSQQCVPFGLKGSDLLL